MFRTCADGFKTNRGPSGRPDRPVNGTLVPGSTIRTTDSKGRRLSHMSYGSYTIPSGEIFLLGENLVVSWDSRYYGPVPAKSLRFPVRPLLTWGR